MTCSDAKGEISPVVRAALFGDKAQEISLEMIVKGLTRGSLHPVKNQESVSLHQAMIQTCAPRPLEVH